MEHQIFFFDDPFILSGLGRIAAAFGLTSEQFGENMRDNYQRHEPEQHQQEPVEFAKEFLCKLVILSWLSIMFSWLVVELHFTTFVSIGKNNLKGS